MDISHITSHTLRRVLSLTERKDELVKLISEIETEISKTISGVASPILKAAAPVTAAVAPAKKTGVKGRRKSSAGRGGLKDKILALLSEAGSQGLKVKEIAERVGSKAANVSVWFSTTGKPLTKKVSPGRYAAKPAAGAAPAAPAAPSKPAKSTPAKPKTKAKPVAKKKVGFKLPKPAPKQK